jgi:uncharacterized membrane protein
MDCTLDSLNCLVVVTGRLLNLAGVVVIAAGAILALVRTFYGALPPGLDRYRAFRLMLGRTILVGLELLVAGDIIRTVAEDPTLPKLVVLGGIVLIRTFLSFSMELEINGRWPWQNPQPSGSPRP